MTIRDVMTTEVKLVHPDTKISEAASVMRDFDIGSLPVMDGGKPMGMLTDRDIAIRVVAEGKDPKQVSVREALSEGLTYAYDDQSLEEAAQLMQEKQLRRLAILDRDKNLVGMVSLGDVAVKGDIQMAGKVTEEVSQPEK